MLTKGRKLKGGENIRGKFETEGGIESSGRRSSLRFKVSQIRVGHDYGIKGDDLNKK